MSFTSSPTARGSEAKKSEPDSLDVPLQNGFSMEDGEPGDPGPKKPFLQRIEGFVFLTCVLIFFQSMYASGLIPSTLQAWEGVFNLTATAVSPAVTMYTVFKLLFGIPLTFYCSSGNIPRHLAWQFALIGVTSLLTGLPWVLTTAASKEAGSDLCYAAGNPGAAKCGAESESGSGIVYIVFIAQAINGFAASCLYALIPAFIEKYASREQSPKYLAYFLACGPLGVAFGFILQGAAIDMGAWGAPYLVCGIFLIILAVVLLKVPGQMATAHTMEPTNDVDVPVGLKAKMLRFVADAKEVMTNSVWWWFVLAATVEAFYIVGIQNYGPKIFSSYFSLTSGTSAMLAGAILVPAAVIGQLIGGFVDSKRSKQLSQTASLTKWIAAIAFIIVALTSTIGCDSMAFDTPGDVACAKTCHCSDTFIPVCENDDEIHFSACYAGCTEFDKANGKYLNCTLCGGSNTTSVTPGVCPSKKCNTLIPFVLIMFAAILITFMNNPPSQIVMMRVVPVRVSASALAINDMIYRLLGSLPSVPVWAFVIDSSCLHFNVDTCGTVTKTCGYYDNRRIQWMLLLLGALPKLLSVLFFTMGARQLLKAYPHLANKAYSEDPPQAAVERERRNSTPQLR